MISQFLLDQFLLGVILFGIAFLATNLLLWKNNPRDTLKLWRSFILLLIFPFASVYRELWGSELLRVELEALKGEVSMAEMHLSSIPFTESLPVGTIIWGTVATVAFLFLVIWPLVSYRFQVGRLNLKPVTRLNLGGPLAEIVAQQKISILCSEKVNGPVATGIFRPKILLPGYFFSQLSTDQQRAILAHEVGHVVHRDILWQLLYRVTISVFWFFLPLYWVYREMTQLQEVMADRFAIDSEDSNRVHLARAIGKIVSINQNATISGLQVGIFNQQDLTRRLTMIRDCKEYGGCFFLPVALTMFFVSTAVLATTEISEEKKKFTIEIDVLHQNRLIARPRITTQAGEKFEVAVNRDDMLSYSISGVIKNSRPNMVLVSTSHCLSQEKIKSGSQHKGCSAAFQSKLKIRLGKKMHFETGEGYSLAYSIKSMP